MKTILTVALMGLFCFIGCNSMARTYPYRVIVVNLSDKGITENRVLDSSGKYNYGSGSIGPFIYKANAGPMETAPNDVFTVRWKDEQNEEHEQKLDLRKRVKRGFKGEIVFIHGADKRFTFEVYESQRQYQIPSRPKS